MYSDFVDVSGSHDYQAWINDSKRQQPHSADSYHSLNLATQARLDPDKAFHDHVEHILGVGLKYVEIYFLWIVRLF